MEVPGFPHLAFGDVRSRKFGGVMSIDDAVFALALRRYLYQRACWGERVTVYAALQVVELARSMGMEPSVQVADAGFEVVGMIVDPRMRPGAREMAIRLVRKHDRAPVVHALYAQFGHLTVMELEFGWSRHCRANDGLATRGA